MGESVGDIGQHIIGVKHLIECPVGIWLDVLLGMNEFPPRFSEVADWPHSFAFP